MNQLANETAHGMSVGVVAVGQPQVDHVNESLEYAVTHRTFHPGGFRQTRGAPLPDARRRGFNGQGHSPAWPRNPGDARRKSRAFHRTSQKAVSAGSSSHPDRPAAVCQCPCPSVDRNPAGQCVSQNLIETYPSPVSHCPDASSFGRGLSDRRQSAPDVELGVLDLDPATEQAWRPGQAIEQLRFVAKSGQASGSRPSSVA